MVILKFVIDSSRNTFLSLAYYFKFGIFSYVLSSCNVLVGDLIMNFRSSKYSFSALPLLNLGSGEVLKGSSFILHDLPLGSRIFNIEKKKSCGGSVARSAGSFSIILRRVYLGIGKLFIAIKLPSSRVLYSSGFSLCSYGSPSNHHFNTLLGLGARSLRVKGRRPIVRGVAMNPVDHPHGGGEGKTSGGRISVSLWGKLSKGGKTVSFLKRKKNKVVFRSFKDHV